MIKKEVIKKLIKDFAVCMLGISAMALVSAAACSYGQAQAARQALALARAQALAEAEAEPEVRFGEIKSEQHFASANVQEESDEPETIAQTRPLSAEKADELIAYAKRYIGVPYVFGGHNPQTGLDCSGFVLCVLRGCGYEIENARAQMQFSEECEWVPEEELMPGDLVFCGEDTEHITHVAIYIGEGRVIHAGSGGVCIADMDGTFWTENICCYGRPLVY